jgi:hypothetical protein
MGQLANQIYRPYSRETAAFPLMWLKQRKFWPTVGRVDDGASLFALDQDLLAHVSCDLAFGDINLVVSHSNQNIYNRLMFFF